MTWRRFLLLIGGLSSQSALVTALEYRRQKKGDVVEVDPEHADDVFKSLFKPSRRQREKRSANE